MVSALQSLQSRIEASTGADRDLDEAIENILNGPSDNPPDYTANVVRCLELIKAKLPEWHWHIGRSATGLMPYVSLSKDKLNVSAEGTTVPLVLLTAIVKALIKQNPKQF